ncbi:aspartyl protease family protein [Pedobacter sandarakinus]|uniref:aspartyl protease family protein n=1 Tax=Pedobacter sandarakinus TaxID=353156 RepID=UPI0022483B15|nr:aspartyl protease family protein [Pedobacter sandarakinus]MCX2573953.1 aspartyl protease family protein [Pedobacter sandarakinus]
MPSTSIVNQFNLLFLAAVAEGFIKVLAILKVTKLLIDSIFMKIKILPTLIFFTPFLLAAQAKIDTLSIASNTSLLVFKGKINGVSANFAFDTGANTGVANSTIATACGLTANKSRTVKDSQENSKSVGYGTMETIEIGSHVFKNQSTAIADMPFLQCNNLYLLGADVINKLNWKFDFETNQAYVSTTPFEPAPEMQETNVKFIGNRHFADFNVAGEEIKSCLIDFGYAGVLEGNNKDKAFKNLASKINESNLLYPAKIFSQGLNSFSIGADVKLTFIDVNFANQPYQNVKLSLRDGVQSKLGFAFFLNYTRQFIFNATQHKYWVLPKKSPVQKNMGPSADIYLIDGKLKVVGLNLAVNNVAEKLALNEEIRSIDGKPANAFANLCEYVLWRTANSGTSQILIEKLNGEKVIVERFNYK